MLGQLDPGDQRLEIPAGGHDTLERSLAPTADHVIVRADSTGVGEEDVPAAIAVIPAVTTHAGVADVTDGGLVRGVGQAQQLVELFDAVLEEPHVHFVVAGDLFRGAGDGGHFYLPRRDVPA
ncbi:hypothetical protein SEA_GARETH_26 [Mycobacterium phage Gareth]|nr:hypothetical protein SEA_GARETH_26 [Mycobacterium phage Gareth]